MRLFIAIPVTDELRSHLAALSGRLEASTADVKWIEPENFHLTVKFIGDVTAEMVSEIEAVCAVAAQATPVFEFSLHGVRTFPRAKPAIKTVFAAIDEGVEAWKALFHRLEPALVDLGVAKESGLAPHITLGRVRSSDGIAELKEAILREESTFLGRQPADRIELVQSFLDPSGAIYQTVQAWPLALAK